MRTATLLSIISPEPVHTRTSAIMEICLTLRTFPHLVHPFIAFHRRTLLTIIQMAVGMTAGCRTGLAAGRIMVTRGLRRRLTSYGDQDFSLFLRKAFIKAMGYSDDALDRPIVGIANTYSDYNPCHGNVPQLIEAAKRGVMLAGGMPIVFPTISIHESFASP